MSGSTRTECVVAAMMVFSASAYLSPLGGAVGTLTRLTFGVSLVVSPTSLSVSAAAAAAAAAARRLAAEAAATAATAARSKVRARPTRRLAGAGTTAPARSSSGETPWGTGMLRAWGDPDQARALPRASSSSQDRSRVGSLRGFRRVRATRANAVPAAARATVGSPRISRHIEKTSSAYRS